MRMRQNGSMFLVIMLVVMVALTACSSGKNDASPSSSPVASQASDSPSPSSEAPPAEKVKLTFAGWAFAEKQSVDLMKPLIEQFQQENPNIEVELMGIQFFDVRQRLTTLLGAGTPPDIAQSYIIWSPSFASMEALEPLDSYLSDDEKKNMINSANGNYGGKQYAATWSPGINIMFWNKNVFKAAGLDPEKPPATWDEFTKAVEATSKVPGVTPIAQTTQKEPSAWNWWMPWLWGEGGDLWNDKNEVIINNERGLAWMNMMKQWADKGYMTTGIDGFTMRQVFAQNKAAFLFDGPWMKGILRDISGKGEAFDKEWGVAKRPLGSNEQQPWTTSADHQLIMFKQSKHKEEAAKLIKFLLRKDVQLKYYELLGLIPSMKDAYDDPKLAGDPYIDTFVKASTDVKPMPFGDSWPVVSDFMMQGVQEVLAGKDAKSALDSVKANIETVVPPKK